MAALSYHEQEDIENTKRIRGILKELPPFCTDFFRGIEPRTSARTRLAYAYDLKTFFDFLKQANPELKTKELRDFPLSILDEIKLMKGPNVSNFSGVDRSVPAIRDCFHQ